MTRDRSTPPVAGAPPVLRPLAPERCRLKNGLDVMTLRRGTIPEIALRLVVPAGAGSPPVGLPGTASLVGRLLTEGAGGRDAREMATWIDGLGVDVTAGVGYDAATVRMHALSELCDEALDLLATLVKSPDFPPSEVERVRAERVDRLRRMRDDPDHVAADLLAELLYDDLPYGRHTWGRPNSVEAIDRERVEAYHGERYVPGGASLVAVGDIPAGFTEMAAERFGDWMGETSGFAPPPSPEAPATLSTVFVDRPGSQQSVIRIAGIGLARGSVDEPRARVMNALLGGLFNSRLNLNLREDKGWTYGARSSLDMRRSAGPLTVRASVETAVTADAIAQMRQEIHRLCESSPSEAEMRTAAGSLTRSLPLRFETASQVAGKLVEQIVYGLADDYWARLVEDIRALTPAEVRDAAARYLNPARLVTLVIGDAEVVIPELEALGPVQVRDAP
jgi:zinc protease